MRTLFLNLAVLVILALPGCNRGHGSAGGRTDLVLRYPIIVEPNTLDPAKMNDVYTSELLQNVYEGLVMFDKDGTVIPALATTWEISPDGRTYTFHLDPAAKFHNGRTVVAEDVKYSVERALWKETASPVAANYLGAIVGATEVAAGKTRALAGMRIVDPHMLAITIDRPRGYFLGMLAYPTGWVVCREAIERSGSRFDEQASVGCGPFVLSDYRHGAKVTLTAFAGYHGGRPKLDRIERPIVLDAQTRQIQFENGEVDFTDISLTDYVGDQSNTSLKGHSLTLPYADTEYVCMHPRLQPVFKDRRVRRAFAMAIDRDEIAKVALRGVWPRADEFVPPGVPAYNPHIHRIPYDPAAARKLLADAGFPDGAGFPKLTLVYTEKFPEVAASAGIIRDSLKQNLGISISLEEREVATLIADVNDRERLPFYILGWIADYPDPQDFLSTMMRSHAPLNHFGYSNLQFDALCDRADGLSDMNARIPLYQQAEQIAMDDVAILPIYHQKQMFLKSPRVHDLDINVMMPVLMNRTWMGK